MNIEDFQLVIEALEPLVSDVTTSAVVIACIYIVFNLLIELLIPLVVIAALYKVAGMFKEWAMTKKIVIKDSQEAVSLDRSLISTDLDVAEMLKEAFRICRHEKGLFESSYIHREHAEFILQAVKEKEKKEKKSS